jgi:hypothetical protein
LIALEFQFISAYLLRKVCNTFISIFQWLLELQKV